MFKAIVKVFKSVRNYKKYAIITPIFMVGEAAVECAIPFVMKTFVKSIKGVDTITPLIPYFLILLAMTIVSITCGILAGLKKLVESKLREFVSEHLTVEEA